MPRVPSMFWPESRSPSGRVCLPVAVSVCVAPPHCLDLVCSSVVAVTLTCALPPVRTVPPQAPYLAFQAHLRATLPPEDLECVYLYPVEFLHLTVASPAPFLHPGNTVRGFAVTDPDQQTAVRVLPALALPFVARVRFSERVRRARGRFSKKAAMPLRFVSTGQQSLTSLPLAPTTR